MVALLPLSGAAAIPAAFLLSSFSRLLGERLVQDLKQRHKRRGYLLLFLLLKFIKRYVSGIWRMQDIHAVIK